MKTTSTVTLSFSDLSEQQKAQLWEVLRIREMPLPHSGSECTVTLTMNLLPPPPALPPPPVVICPVSMETILAEYPPVPPDWMADFMTGGYDDEEGVFMDSVEAGVKEICGPRARWLDVHLIAELRNKFRSQGDTLRLYVATPVVFKTWGGRMEVEYRAPICAEHLCSMDIDLRGDGVPGGISRDRWKAWKVTWV